MYHGQLSTRYRANVYRSNIHSVMILTQRVAARLCMMDLECTYGAEAVLRNGPRVLCAMQTIRAEMEEEMERDNELAGQHYFISTEKRERRNAMRAENMRILNESGVPFQVRPNACLLRFGKLHVDFYPSTGKWTRTGKKAGPPVIIEGNAEELLAWLKGQPEYVEACTKNSR